MLPPQMNKKWQIKKRKYIRRDMLKKIKEILFPSNTIKLEIDNIKKDAVKKASTKKKPAKKAPVKKKTVKKKTK